MRVYKPYRGLFGTPFWTEGGALYWEMLFLGFKLSEDSGESHRACSSGACTAVRESSFAQLSFGKDDAPAVHDFLVDRVGHERRQRDRGSQTIV